MRENDRSQPGPTRLATENEVNEKVMQVNSQVRRMEDSLERAAGALEGQAFANGRPARYCETQVKLAMDALAEMKLQWQAFLTLIAAEIPTAKPNATKPADKPK